MFSVTIQSELLFFISPSILDTYIGGAIMSAEKLKVYFTHAQTMDHMAWLYRQLSKSRLAKDYDMVLSHDSHKYKHSPMMPHKTRISLADIVIIETTMGDVWVGMAAAWAENKGKPVGLLHQLGQGYTPLGMVTSVREVYDANSPPECNDSLVSAFERLVQNLSRYVRK